MRKLLPVVAAAALAGSGAFVSIAAFGGSASAAKAPVAATCTSLVGDTTIGAATGGDPILSTVTGCTSTDTKVTGDALDVASLTPPSTSVGTVYFTNGKTVTFNEDTVATSGLDCPTFLGMAANEQETTTITVTGGNAKVTANGGFNICAYVSGSGDNTIHQESIGPVTL